MNIRYMFISMLVYLGIFILLILINMILKTLLDFNPYVQLLLFIIYFILDIFLTRICLHMPALRRIIYDPGY